MSCPNTFHLDGVVDRHGELIDIPCGKCLSCQLQLQKLITDRLFCAWHTHAAEGAAFVTFTYDDEHLVFEKGFRLPTLSLDHAHKYLDNIKHLIKKTFEYYYCGEYGDSFNRPHYHALFFGLDYLQYLDFFKRSWKYGSVKVLPCTAGAFRYVSKYVVSPSSNFKDKEFFDTGRIPPFRKMSRGLGLSVFRDHIDEIEQNGFFVYKSRRIYINKYYFNKLILRDKVLLTALERQESKRNKDLADKAKNCRMSVPQYRQTQAEKLEKSLESQRLNKNNSLF